MTPPGLTSRRPAGAVLWEMNLLDLMTTATIATPLAVTERAHLTAGSTADLHTCLVTRPGADRRRAAPIDRQKPLSP